MFWNVLNPRLTGTVVALLAKLVSRKTAAKAKLHRRTQKGPRGSNNMAQS